MFHHHTVEKYCEINTNKCIANILYYNTHLITCMTIFVDTLLLLLRHSDNNMRINLNQTEGITNNEHHFKRTII